MPVTPFSLVAFRCTACGRLHEAGHAGESPHPHACRVCGAGVRFDPKTGAKKLDPSVWEVLADATPERLAELGLDPAHVERHTSARGQDPGRPPQHIARTAQDGAASSDEA